MSEGNKLTIPVAIVIAGALIAGAIYLVNKDSRPADNGNDASKETTTEVRPVTSEDHILGNPNAEIVLIEYSDTECPFCKEYHNTLHQIIDEFGRDGRVAWVYRHFPIPQLHAKAPKEAEATECAAELGGNTGFWNYLDKIFEETPSNDGLDLALLPQFAEDIGLPRAQFETCLNSGKYSEKIEQQFNEAVAAGARGTPHTIMLIGDEQIPLSGAYPYESIRSTINTILSQGVEGLNQ